MLKPHGLFIFAYSSKNETKNAAAADKIAKIQFNTLKSIPIIIGTSF